jgi:glycosyltransferase involved in cell wall biosynthesis
VVIPYAKEESSPSDPEFTEKIKQIKKDRFTFISLSQWSYRKGFDKLIKAFLLEFKDEPVNLILKTYINRSFHNIDETRVVSQKIENEKKKLSFDGKSYDGKCSLIVINSLLDKKQINSLYEVSDCMVTCTRGEGFGLPMAEFISFEKPVIVPDKGGHLDFCSEDNFFIESSFEPFENCPNHFYSSDMNLVEVSLSSTMKRMREAFELYKANKEMYYLRGKKSANFANDYLCLDYNVDAFKNALGLN